MKIKKSGMGFRGFCKFVLTGTLTLGLGLSLAGCGKGEADQESGAKPEAKEWVYVAEYRELGSSRENSFYDAQLLGDYLYYPIETWGDEGNSYKVCKYSLADGSTTETELTLPGESSCRRFSISQDGSIYALFVEYQYDEATGESSRIYNLAKIDSQGTQVWMQDMSQYINQQNDQIDNLILDGQGRIYLLCQNYGEGSVGSRILLFDPEGAYQGDVSLSSGRRGWVDGMMADNDGKVYTYGYGETGYDLTQVDFDKKSMGEPCKNFPGNGNASPSAGMSQDILTHDGVTVYEYDLASQTSKELFKWLDSDIVGSNVRNVGVTSEGKIAALISDWSTDEYSLAILTKTPGSEVVQKEEIVIGVMNSDQELMSAAVRFNRSNDKYHVSIREYIDRNGEFTENTWPDAQKRLNNDLTSGNAPDLIDLSYVNLEQMMEKGVFEDLYSWLEASSVLNREDYLENILDGYTFDGKLAGIPKSFSVSTLVASSADLGEEMGWSLDEMIAYADAHPNAQLFDNVNQATMMQFIMRCNEGAFVDWSSGTCSFNSDDFKKALEFVSRFPEDFEGWSEGNLSTPTKIQNGEVLLEFDTIYDFREIQVSIEMFEGKAVCIGYPTVDGSAGVLMNTGDMYGIVSGSKNKEGAWAFLEHYLSTPVDQFYSFGFPAKKAELEEMAKEAVKIEYATDENGEIILDENGEPYINNAGGGIGYQDGWSYEYHVPTQEEVDMVMELMKVARPVSSGNDEIMTIINEEAAAFFKGQKSVDEVADTIQRRAQTYVSENS